MIDAYVDASERKRSKRSWSTWLAILGLSLLCLYAFNNDWITGWVGTVAAIAGIVGVIGFLAFLSTKPFGRSGTSARWWWLR